VRRNELWTANLAALAAGLVLFFAFRPPQILPLAAAFIVGLLVVVRFRSRSAVADPASRSRLFRGFGMLLNGLYGSFFAILAYYLILAFTGQIGYPYR
jgi:hypothetical protein